MTIELNVFHCTIVHLMQYEVFIVGDAKISVT